MSELDPYTQLYSRAFTGYSKTPTGKATKGSVVVLSSNGRLQLRFRVNGKRYYLSTGYPDTKEYRKLAEAKAKSIQSDIDLDRFDPTSSQVQASISSISRD